MSADLQHDDTAKPHPHRLILCFDGTGNEFQGNPGDTNIVKLYNMFDRNNNDQMHYYQPGIGTYPAEGPVNVNWFRSLMRKFEAVMDQALATSFDSHVIAGYKFIMRHYRPGTKIYVFGFSRGAFTARFLSRMISHVGLLSIGNDELVPFAYQVYQKYEQNRGGQEVKHKDFMNTFKRYFCRTERDIAKHNNEAISDNESGIKVHFLGLFDCVSSVGNLDIPFFQKNPPLPAVRGTARHIRHAVAIDERRVKFKAALFSQEQKKDESHKGDDIKEIWFPGNHGDVGGGWPLENSDNEHQKDGGVCLDSTHDAFQLSDIALKWMMDEIDNVDRTGELHDHLAWDPKEKGSFLERFDKHIPQMIKARMHDTLAFKGVRADNTMVMLWNFMEYLPGVIKRWEYVERPTTELPTWKYIGWLLNLRGFRNIPTHYTWEYVMWPLNRGNRRDIPSAALFHDSVIKRMQLEMESHKQLGSTSYMPSNQMVFDGDSALTNGSTTETTEARNIVDKEIKTTLAELAKQYKPMVSNYEDCEAEPLLQKGTRFHFKPVEHLTVGSVLIEDQERVVAGPQTSDRIHRVAKRAK